MDTHRIVLLTGSAAEHEGLQRTIEQYQAGLLAIRDALFGEDASGRGIEDVVQAIRELKAARDERDAAESNLVTVPLFTIEPHPDPVYGHTFILPEQALGEPRERGD